MSAWTVGFVAYAVVGLLLFVWGGRLREDARHETGVPMLIVQSVLWPIGVVALLSVMAWDWATGGFTE